MISDLHKAIDNLKSINNFEKQIMKVMDLEKLYNYLEEKIDKVPYDTPHEYENMIMKNPIYFELEAIQKNYLKKN